MHVKPLKFNYISGIWAEHYIIYIVSRQMIKRMRKRSGYFSIIEWLSDADSGSIIKEVRISFQIFEPQTCDDFISGKYLGKIWVNNELILLFAEYGDTENCRVYGVYSKFSVGFDGINWDKGWGEHTVQYGEVYSIIRKKEVHRNGKIEKLFFIIDEARKEERTKRLEIIRENIEKGEEEEKKEERKNNFKFKFKFFNPEKRGELMSGQYIGCILLEYFFLGFPIKPYKVFLFQKKDNSIFAIREDAIDCREGDWKIGEWYDIKYKRKIKVSTWWRKFFERKEKNKKEEQ